MKSTCPQVSEDVIKLDSGQRKKSSKVSDEWAMGVEEGEQGLML